MEQKVRSSVLVGNKAIKYMDKFYKHNNIETKSFLESKK